jgi:phage terminase large subunit-like protein
MRQRAKRDRVDYLSWSRAGLLTATPGDVIDYKFIRAAVVQDSTNYQLLEVAFDPWGASKLTQDLSEDGLNLVEFRQGFASMSPAMKETEKLLLSGKLAHGNNKILTWMASNVVVKRDPAGNIKPDKAKSRERIDGLVALIMATDRALRNEGKVKPSAYKTRGIRAL